MISTNFTTNAITGDLDTEFACERHYGRFAVAISELIAVIGELCRETCTKQESTRKISSLFVQLEDIEMLPYEILDCFQTIYLRAKGSKKMTNSTRKRKRGGIRM